MLFCSNWLSTTQRIQCYAILSDALFNHICTSLWLNSAQLKAALAINIFIVPKQNRETYENGETAIAVEKATRTAVIAMTENGIRWGLHTKSMREHFLLIFKMEKVKMLIGENNKIIIKNKKMQTQRTYINSSFFVVDCSHSFKHNYPFVMMKILS